LFDLQSGMSTLDNLQAIKNKHSSTILKIPGVVGLDIDLDDPQRPAFIAYLDTQDPRASSSLPDELDGVPVRTMYLGPVEKQKQND